MRFIDKSLSHNLAKVSLVPDKEYKIGETKFKKARTGGPGPQLGSGEKAKNFFPTWQKLLKFAKKYLVAIVIAILCSVISAIFTIIGPDLLSKMTDVISEGMVSKSAGGAGINLDAVYRLGIMLAVFYCLSWACGVTQSWIFATVTNQITKKMRSDIVDKINRVTFGYINKTTTGNILSRVTNDVDTIGQSFNQAIGIFVSAIALLIGSLFMMLITDLTMTLTAILSSAIGFVFMFLIMGKSQKYFLNQQNALGAVNGFIEEIFAGQLVVKAYSAENKSIDKFDTLNQELITSGTKAACLSGLMMPFMIFVGNLGYVAICVVGAILVMNGTISIGVIVAFMMYVRYFTQPLQNIAQGVQSLQSAAAAGERIFEFLQADEFEDSRDSGNDFKTERGEVIFDSVTFGYEKDHPIITDFSAIANPGEKIAIVGHTGAGKTTLVNLLMRFYDIDSGDIKIDGISTKSLKRAVVHEQFCMVLQDSWLFEGTVRENLIYCTNCDDEDKMIEAAKAVGIDHYIRTLRNGYDTILDESVNLSNGQRQQLTIARAMISDRPMLILDEATSSVDTRTEAHIQVAMDKLMANRTSFVIAHRLSTIKNADKILVVNSGEIIECGKHEELLQKKGYYAELYNSQFEQS